MDWDCNMIELVCGRSCGSCVDNMSDDSCYTYLPETVGHSCIGQNSCTISLTAGTASTTIDGVTVSGDMYAADSSEQAGVAMSGSPCGTTVKFKALAHCS